MKLKLNLCLIAISVLFASAANAVESDPPFSLQQCKGMLAGGNLFGDLGYTIGLGTLSGANRWGQQLVVTRMLDEAQAGAKSSNEILNYVNDVNLKDPLAKASKEKVISLLREAALSQDKCRQLYERLETPDPRHPSYASKSNNPYSFNAYRIDPSIGLHGAR